MILRWFVRPNAYYDSMKLMRVSEALAQQPGVIRAAAVMATPLNMDLLADDGLLPESEPTGPPEVQATPEDLLVAVLGEDETSADEALAQLDALLTVRPESGDQIGQPKPPLRTLEQAPDGANLAVIAVPGPYAAAEAYAALRAGLHVFLFSDNVPLEDEVRLKELAAEKDLLMMGPDCGTAIIGGAGLGFANRVKRGPVGIVGASGTGIQQLCCLLDQAGIGIAQAIGTGGRDLSDAVGGSMTRRAIWMLEADDEVQVIAVISKPPDPNTARRLQQELLGLQKPAVVCLLGEDHPDAGPVRYARNLTDMAMIVYEMLGMVDPGAQPLRQPRPKSGDTPRGNRVYGLYAGGTLCSEAAQVLDAIGVPHHLLDLGADQYTQGRAHPILDPRLRTSMLEDLVGREDVGSVLIDVILGDLAHPDPAGAVAPALEQFHLQPRGIRPLLVAALIGTRGDPQGLEEQRETLERAGAKVLFSNAQAASVAAHIIAGNRRVGAGYPLGDARPEGTA